VLGLKLFANFYIRQSGVNSVKINNEALTHRVYLWTSDFTVAVHFLSMDVIMDF